MQRFATHGIDRDDRDWLRGNPHAWNNDVQYVLDMGDGFTVLHMPWGLEEGPVWVWRCVEDLDYTAPKHVSDALDQQYEFTQELEAAERRAGWDARP